MSISPLPDPDGAAKNPGGFSPAPAPSAIGANASFRAMWLAEGVSVFGTSTTTILLPLLAINAFDAGPLWLGLITAATWLPWLIVGLPVGAWVDAQSPKRVMIASDLCSALFMASVPLAWWAGVLTLPHLLVVAFVTGVASVFFRAAYPALLTAVVRADHLEDANSRLVTTESVMEVAGPGVGGVISQFFHAAWGLGLDALSFLASAVSLTRVRGGDRPVLADGPTEPLLDRISHGLRLVWRDRVMRYFIIQGGASNLGLTGYGALLVLFLMQECGLDDWGVGVVFMISSLGGIAGAALAPRMSARLGSARAVIALTLAGGPTAALILMGSPGWGVAAALVGLTLVSFGVLGENVLKSAWRQRYVPADMLARAITTSQVVNYGSIPIAGVLAGWLGEVYGVRLAMGALVVIHIAAALSIVVSPIAGLRELPAEMEARALDPD